MSKEKFHGIIAYLVTPFKNNGEIVDTAILR